MLRSKAKKRTLIKDANKNGKVKISKISKQVDDSSIIEDNSSEEKNSFENEKIRSLLDENNQHREENNSMIEKNTSTTDENNCQTQKNCQIKSLHRDNLNKIKILECEFCDETFGERTYRNDKKYREHLKIHMKPYQKSYEKSNKDKGNLPICEVCDHRSKTNISTHFKTVHKITKKLKKEIECYICYLETTSIEGKDLYQVQGTLKFIFLTYIQLILCVLKLFLNVQRWQHII